MTKNITLELPAHLAENLLKLAAAENLSVNELAEAVLSDYVSEQIEYATLDGFDDDAYLGKE